MSEIGGSGPRHVPVMPVEVVSLLEPRPGQVFVDCTCGAGGHSLLLAQLLGPDGLLIAVDRDPAMLALCRERLSGFPARFVQGSFDQLGEVLEEVGAAKVDGVLADLGICSVQLDDPERGFSFMREGPLDMRMDPSIGLPASALLSRMSERELADVFFQYGEERQSRRIARRIVAARESGPIATTFQLADLVRSCLPRPRPKGGRMPIDPATRVFQALRIAVNDELGALEGLLRALPRHLKPGGRAALMSFHSLEDRLVKTAFRDGPWEVLTKKPIEAGEDETARNPRSRSAKLRAARRKDE